MRLASVLGFFSAVVVLPACNCQPSDPVDDAGSDPGPSVDAGGRCEDGAACTPTDACAQTGRITCLGNVGTCVTATPRANGTACGVGRVCNQGACVACAANESCTPASACRLGRTECSTGTSTCADTGTALDAGTSCGTDQVCSPAGTCITCAANTACTSNVACRVGVLACGSGAPVCVPGSALADGASCDGGVCAGGSCRSELVISTAVNLSTDTLTAGRTCAEAPSWRLTTLGAGTATLSTAVDAGCLAAGDRVLLLNLQGTPTDFRSVGNYDVRTVVSVNGATVSFGPSVFAGEDAGVPFTTLTTDGGQRLALFRIPVFGDVLITDAGVVTASGFDGERGGVVAFRARRLRVEGTISAVGLGYRSGDWSQDDNDCSDSLVTGSGESITGPSRLGTAANGGGAGGLGPASGQSYNSNDPLNASAAHADAGAPGANGGPRAVGGPGLAYGTPGGLQLTLGSGAAGNLTCTNTFVGPPRYLREAPSAGGVIYLSAQELRVGPAGRITADAIPPGRSTAAAGGSVLLRAGDVDVGTNRVTAVGRRAVTALAFSNNSSPGYVSLHSVRPATGTTVPAATETRVNAP